jgi:hypothetical protein
MCCKSTGDPWLMHITRIRTCRISLALPNGVRGNIAGMRSSLSVLVAISLAVLAGCGVNPATSISVSAYPNLSGNWEAIGLPPQFSTGLTTPIAAFLGALQTSNGNVTGTMRAVDTNQLAPCVPLNQDLTVSGTVSTSGNLVLTVPMAGGTATLSATLNSDPQSFNTGLWTIVDGSCAMASTSMAIVQFAPVTGTYSGTLTSFGTTNNATMVTAMLVQSPTPNADGQFPLTGTLTYAGTGSCSGSYPLIPEYVTAGAISQTSGSALVSAGVVDGVIQPSATSINATTTVLTTSCLGGPLSGTLTRQ